MPQADYAITTEIFYSGAWHDISADVRNRDDVTVERGRPDESGRTRPGRLTFTLNNGVSNIGRIVGRYTPRNPRSDLYGLIGRNTPVRQSIDGHRRFTGEISEWPTRWDLADSEVWIAVQAYGILRRLGQGGGKTIRSAFRRRIEAVGADAYWPLDGGELAAIGDPIFGASPLVVPAGEEFSIERAELAPWFGSGLHIRPSGTLDPAVTSEVTLTATGAVTMPATGIDYWSADYLVRFPGGAPAFSNLTGDAESTASLNFRYFGNGTAPFDWEVNTTYSTVFPFDQAWNVKLIRVSDAAIFENTTLTTAASGVPMYGDGLVHHLRLLIDYTTTPNPTWSFAVDGIAYVTGNTFTTEPGTQGIGRVEVTYSGFAPSPPPATFGHVVLRHSDSGALEDTLQAGIAHFAEAAGRRIERLCAEDGIPFSAVGDLDNTETLGQQQVEPVLKLLDQAREADGGILFEDRDDAGLVYATYAGLYNRTPVLALDYASGHISPPFDPVDDDQHVVNDVTCRRINGGDRQAVKDTGPLSILAPPAGVGRYDREVALNVASDERLMLHAGSRVERGTFDETRFPEVGFRVMKHPELLAAAAAADMGDVVTIDNPPPWLPPEQIGLVLAGYRERYSLTDWSMIWNTDPRALYVVGVLDVDRLDTDTATVATAFTAGTGTSLSVAYTPGTPVATVGITDFQIRVAGVVLRVRKIENAASPQTFTVDQQPVNGVAKTIAAGTPVHLAKPWRLAF